jgi:hypothetical protein
MARNQWKHEEIEMFLKATVCTAILRELQRRRMVSVGRESMNTTG